MVVTLALQSPGVRLMRRLDALADHSDDEGALTRLFLSPAHRAAVRAESGRSWKLILLPHPRPPALQPVRDT